MLYPVRERWWWRIRFIVQQLLHDQRTAKHGRRSLAVRTRHKKRGLCHQSATRRIGGQGNFDELVGLRGWKVESIVRGHGCIDRDKVRIDEIRRRQVFLHQRAEELLHFTLGILLHSFVKAEVCPFAIVDSDCIVLIELCPLADESVPRRAFDLGSASMRSTC